MRNARERDVASDLYNFVSMEKSGNPTSQFLSLCEVSHRARAIEKCPLKRSRDGIPFHDKRRSKTAQQMLLLSNQFISTRRIGAGTPHYLSMIIGEPLLIVRQRREASFELPELLGVIKPIRCFVTILVGIEHLSSLRDSIMRAQH
jgi:hypothetical protein